MKSIVKNVRELNVYRLAFETAMEIYALTKTFPVEERYSLSDQIRRSSRSVCANLAESWHKRRYLAAFISKLTDSITESVETQTWLDFSRRCGYIDEETYKVLFDKYDHVNAQIYSMIRHAGSFCSRSIYTADQMRVTSQ
jgi:four helix bundle protein